MPSHPDPRLPARQAIERYWRYLLGPAAFPPVALVATEFSKLSFDLLAFLSCVMFFLSFAPVVWLLFTQKVRYSFWLVAGATYFAAAVATGIAALIIRLIAG